MVISVLDPDPSRQPATRLSRAPALPVRIRERYGSITLAEVLRFHLTCWNTRRNLRRRRRRTAAPSAQPARAELRASAGWTRSPSIPEEAWRHG